MAKYYVLIPIQHGTLLLWPGTLIDDAVDPVAAIQAAGGSGSTWVSTDSTVATAAVAAQTAKARGRTPEECAGIMVSAALASAKAAGEVTRASLGAGAPLAKRTVTIGHADLTSAVNGEAQAINVGDVLPANAVVIAHEVNVATLFSGGSASAVVLDLGGTDVDAIVSDLNVFTGSTTGALSPRTGVHAQGKFSGEQLVATFTPDAGHTLAGLSAGALTITVWYVAMP